ncbi:MAG: hypothetical protein C4335_06930 [Armatimonadota bacterium]
MSASTNGKMKQRFRWQAVCVVLAIGLQGCYSPGQFRHAQPIADRFIHLLSSGQYTQAVSMIDPKKRNSYQSLYLAQRWTQREHAVGKPDVTSLSGKVHRLPHRPFGRCGEEHREGSEVCVPDHRHERFV